MGCASSTQAVIDPHTGKQSNKHKMGGAFPGNRRTPQQAYTPGPGEFNSQGQGTAHFISYGGGNALVLQNNSGEAQPVVNNDNKPKPQLVQVTLPEGVHAGQTIHVQAPDGRLNEIIIPDGFGPGSSFTVEFADQSPKPTYQNPAPQTHSAPSQQQSLNVPMSAATPANNNNNNNNHDDGFATGFQNPSFVPAPAVVGTDQNIDLNLYPVASNVKPVYSSAPTYPASTY